MVKCNASNLKFVVNTFCLASLFLQIIERSGEKQKKRFRLNTIIWISCCTSVHVWFEQYKQSEKTLRFFYNSLLKCLSLDVNQNERRNISSWKMFIVFFYYFFRKENFNYEIIRFIIRFVRHICV